MTEETKTREQVTKVDHKNIYSALSALQGDLQSLEKDGLVDFKKKSSEERVSYRYTTLDKTVEMLYPLLPKHGLSFNHELGENSIECVLTHETYSRSEIGRRERKIKSLGGEEETISEPVFEVENQIRSGKLIIDTKKADMKEVGGQITYARRYTLALVAGLASEEDKDLQLEDEANKNVGDFAFKTAKEKLEKATGDQLTEQVAFLQKELELAEALELGKGTKAPSLGLKAEKYRELITIANSKK